MVHSYYFVKIKAIYLGRYSEMIERLGGRVTAPINRTIFGCRNLRIIRTLHQKDGKQINFGL